MHPLFPAPYNKSLPSVGIFKWYNARSDQMTAIPQKRQPDIISF